MFHDEAKQIDDFIRSLYRAVFYPVENIVAEGIGEKMSGEIDMLFVKIAVFIFAAAAVDDFAYNGVNIVV